MATTTLNILKCNFLIEVTNGILTTREIQQEILKQKVDTNTMDYVDIVASIYSDYTPLEEYKTNRYYFKEDLENGKHKEEKVIAFFYVKNTYITTLINRNAYFSRLYNFNINDIKFKNNLVSNIKKINVKMFLKEKEKEVKTQYKINPYNTEEGLDPFDMNIKYVDENGVEQTTELLDIERQKVYSRFNLNYKELVYQAEVEFIDNNINEDLYYLNIDKSDFNVGKSIEFSTLLFPMWYQTSKIIESKVENIKGIIKRNIVIEFKTGFYYLIPADFKNIPFILNRNCNNVQITEKINEDADVEEKIERNVIFSTNIEDLYNISELKTTFPLPGDYIYIINPDVNDNNSIKQQINTISWELTEKIEKVKFDLDEQLSNYTRQLKRNIINVAKAKDKENVKKNEDYNKKKIDSITVKTNKKMKELEAEYKKVIEEKRQQVRKDERAIIQLANYQEKVLGDLNTINQLIVKNYNTLIEKIDKDMPLITPDSFKVDPSYPALAPPIDLTDIQSQSYIDLICNGVYKNPWK